MGLSGCNPVVSQGRSVVEKGDSSVIFVFIYFIMNAVNTHTHSNLLSNTPSNTAEDGKVHNISESTPPTV